MPPVPLRAESREESASQPKHTKKIGVHHPPKLGLRHILKCASGRHAGVVYDSIEFVASSREYRSSRCLDRGLAEDIELLDVDAILHVRLFQCLLEQASLLHVPHRGEDAPAPRCENDRCRLSNSGRCSGN